jgi:hypothetical protein
MARRRAGETWKPLDGGWLIEYGERQTHAQQSFIK